MMSTQVTERSATLQADIEGTTRHLGAVPAMAQLCLNSRSKRLLDLTGSIFGLVVLSPLFLLLAILIFSQDRGPVFFRQKRTGLNGKEFLIWKFRTMSHQPRPGPFQQTKGPHDPRVTPLGRWLRLSSIDELPQLLNVVKGEMSLVGPRPHPVELDRAFSGRLDGYDLRHSVRPGLTGSAQISGARGPINSKDDMQKRLDLDLAYILDWNAFGDILLILRTLVSAKAKQGAF